jgi:hypothetical protein
MYSKGLTRSLSVFGALVLLTLVGMFLGPAAGPSAQAQGLVEYPLLGNALPVCVRVASRRPLLRPVGEMRVPVEELISQLQTYQDEGEWTLSCRSGEVPVLVVTYMDPDSQFYGIGQPGDQFPEPPWWFPPSEAPPSLQ